MFSMWSRRLFMPDHGPCSMLPWDPPYNVEAFTLPAQRGSNTRRSTYPELSRPDSQPVSLRHVRSLPAAASMSRPTSLVPSIIGPPISLPRTIAEEPREPQHVYVVHHDAGRPPVTVYEIGRAHV